MTLKLYADHFSQPSRSVILFVNINKLPHTFISTTVFSGQVFHNLIQNRSP